jgi:hypothetical protein
VSLGVSLGLAMVAAKQGRTMFDIEQFAKWKTNQKYIGTSSVYGINVRGMNNE